MRCELAVSFLVLPKSDEVHKVDSGRHSPRLPASPHPHPSLHLHTPTYKGLENAAGVSLGPRTWERNVSKVLILADSPHVMPQWASFLILGLNAQLLSQGTAHAHSLTRWARELVGELQPHQPPQLVCVLPSTIDTWRVVGAQ